MSGIKKIALLVLALTSFLNNHLLLANPDTSPWAIRKQSNPIFKALDGSELAVTLDSVGHIVSAVGVTAKTPTHLKIVFPAWPARRSYSISGDGIPPTTFNISSDGYGYSLTQAGASIQIAIKSKWIVLGSPPMTAPYLITSVVTQSGKTNTETAEVDGKAVYATIASHIAEVFPRVLWALGYFSSVISAHGNDIGFSVAPNPAVLAANPQNNLTTFGLTKSQAVVGAEVNLGVCALAAGGGALLTWAIPAAASGGPPGWVALFAGVIFANAVCGGVGGALAYVSTDNPTVGGAGFSNPASPSGNSGTSDPKPVPKSDPEDGKKN